MAKQSSTIAIRLPDHLATELDRLAEETGRSKSYWSYRVGDCRMIALIEDRSPVIVVLSVDHRRGVYRKGEPVDPMPQQPPHG